MQLVNGAWRDGLGGAGTTLGVFAVATRASDTYVAGNFHIAGDVIVHNLARWDGTAWHAVGGGTDGVVFALAFDTAGNLYAAGGFRTAGNVVARGVAKWDGTSWTQLGSGIAAGTIYALAIDATGNVYAGGDFGSISGVTAANIAMWNGSTWSALGAGCTDPVHCLAVDPVSGVLYAGGDFRNAGGPPLLPPGGIYAKHVARWQGGSWSPLGGSVDGPVYALAIASNGVLFVGGNFAHAGNQASSCLAAWNPSTAQWSDLSGGHPDNAVKALLLIQDRYLHVGGDFTFSFSIFGAVNQFFYYGVVDTQTKAWGPMGYIDFSVATLAADSAGNIYAAGIFDQVQNLVAHNIAKWNGSAWSTLGEADSVSDVVMTLAADGAGNTYVGGLFGWAGVQPSSRVARWNGSTWSAMPLRGSGGTDAGFVRAMALDPAGTLYVGGDRGGALYAVAYRWTGASWSPFGQAIDGEIFTLAAAASGSLYVGGSFVNGIGGGGAKIALNYLALWNGSSYVAVGGGMNNCVVALALDKAGGLYAGGFFTSAGGVSVNYIAHWNGANWSALAGGTDGPVQALAVAPNGDVYIGGSFTVAGGVAASRVARWNGAAWSALGSGVDAPISAIVIDDLGTVIVAGSFSNAGGVPASRIAKWNGTTWSVLDNGMDDDVYALALDSGGNLVAGGDFSTAGGKASCYFAYYTATAPPGSPNPPGAGPPPVPAGTQPTPHPLPIWWWIERMLFVFNQFFRLLTCVAVRGMGSGPTRTSS